MGKAFDIIKKYSDGKLSLEEANAEMERNHINLILDPGKNVITDEERAANIVSDDPTKVTGYGFMYHGVGGPEKMHVVNGKFAYDTGFPKSWGCFFAINDKIFAIDNDKIVEMDEEEDEEEVKE